MNAPRIKKSAIIIGVLVTIPFLHLGAKGKKAVPKIRKTEDSTASIAWGPSSGSFMYGLSFKKAVYKIGEPIDGWFYIQNRSSSGVSVLKQSVRLRDWNFVISGPPGGDYEWKGPEPKFGLPGKQDFKTLKPDEILKFKVSPHYQIEQRAGPGKVQWNTILPGTYSIKVLYHGWGGASGKNFMDKETGYRGETGIVTIAVHK
jgi:hypothetical protein